MTGRVNATWDFVLRNVVAGRERVTDTTDDVAVTYALTHNGTAAGSGSLAWEDHGYENAWVKRLTLPATAGIFIATGTISATIDATSVTGSLQASLEVIA